MITRTILNWKVYNQFASKISKGQKGKTNVAFGLDHECLSCFMYFNTFIDK
jgi:hypothetical protein